MRITIQVTCDTPAEAQDAIARLTRPKTWEDDLPPPKVSEARIDQIMAGSGAAPPLPSGKDYSKGEPEPVLVRVSGMDRPNVSPGEPSITKIGAESKERILKWVREPGSYLDTTKFAEHLKLLWKRGEIKFSGTEYFI